MSTDASRRSATPPAAVRQLAAARPVCLAWENEHALTFEVGDGPDRCFVKWAPAGSPLDLAAESARMTWAAAFTPVPRVLGHGADGEGSWLVTAALPGHSAASPRWLADPRTAVIAIGEGLRAMHDALPVADCPFSWMAEDRIAAAERAAAAGRLDTSHWGRWTRTWLRRSTVSIMITFSLPGVVPGQGPDPGLAEAGVFEPARASRPDLRPAPARLPPERSPARRSQPSRATAHTAELEHVRSDAAREREELRGALESRARILEESRDELRGRAERAERELDRLRQGTGGGLDAPAPTARRRGRQGKATEAGQ